MYFMIPVTSKQRFGIRKEFIGRTPRLVESIR